YFTIGLYLSSGMISRLRHHGWRWLLLLLVFSTSPLYAYRSLNYALDAIGFDPFAPGNAIVVFASDVHMCLDVSGLPAPVTTTDFDDRFVTNINAMYPPPARLVFCGDESSSLSPMPGADGLLYIDAMRNATNEMKCFLKALNRLNLP